VNKAPNTNQNNSSELGYNVKFWSGIVVAYEYQQDQLSNGNGWRYKVRIFGDNSDVDQVDDKDLSYADVLLSTDAGSGAAYKLRSARISQGDTVYGIKGPNLPAMIIGVEARKRSTILYTEGKFKTLSGFYGDLKKNNILSGEFNEQLGPATPGGAPYTKTKSEREPATEKLNELGIDPNEEGVIENVNEQITPPKNDISEDWNPGDNLSTDKLFDIQEKTKKKESPGRILFAAATQALVQGIIEEETSKKLKAEANQIMNVEKLSTNTYTVAGVEYDTSTGLPVENTPDRVIDGRFIPGGFPDPGSDANIDTSDIEVEGTFTEDGDYIPPDFTDPTTNPDDYVQY